MGRERKSFDLTQMSVKEIIQTKDEVKLLLASLEDQYRKAETSDKTYKESKGKNKKKLEEIKNVLIDMGLRDIVEQPPKEFGRRDKTLNELNVNVDKLQNKMEILVKNVGDIKSILRSIGNLENISNMNKEVMQKMREMDNIGKMTNRLSDNKKRMVK